MQVVIFNTNTSAPQVTAQIQNYNASVPRRDRYQPAGISNSIRLFGKLRYRKCYSFRGRYYRWFRGSSADTFRLCEQYECRCNYQRNAYEGEITLPGNAPIGRLHLVHVVVTQR